MKGKNPLRIIVGNLESNENITLIADDEPLLIFNTIEAKTIRNKEWILFDGRLEQVMDKLHKLNIQSIIVEGGANILNQFINNNLWDEAHRYIGQKTFSQGVTAPRIENAIIDIHTIDTDKLYVYLNS